MGEFTKTVPQTRGQHRVSESYTPDGVAIDLISADKETARKGNELAQTEENAIRDWVVSHKLSLLVRHPVYYALSAVLVFLALFYFDFSRAALPKNSDVITDVIVGTVFSFLLADCLFQCIVYQNYLGSFFFWLDFVGTLTMLSDLSVTWDLIASIAPGTDLSAVRSGRAGRAARSAASLRVSRIFMWARAIRFVRLARVIQGNGDTEHELNQIRSSILQPHSLGNVQEEEAEEHSDSEQTESKSEMEKFSEERYSSVRSSRIGEKVADTINRGVVLGILTTVLVLPWLMSGNKESYSALSTGATMFQEHYQTYGNDTALAAMVQVLLRKHPAITTARIGGLYYEEKKETDLRITEILQWDNSDVLIRLDISDTIAEEHWLNIGFTLMVVVLFSGLSTAITITLRKLIVTPLERMTRIIQEFTKQFCILSGDFQTQQKLVEELLETDVVERAIQTMSSIFQSIQEHRASIANVRAKENRGKAWIKSRQSVIEINLTQKKVTEIPPELIRKQIKHVAESTSLELFSFEPTEIPELNSIQTCLNNPVCFTYFRFFCKDRHVRENLLFVEEVRQFKHLFAEEFKRIFQTYLSLNSPKQLTISAADLQAVRKAKEEGSFSVSTFDKILNETVAILSAQVFQDFRNSKAAKAYVQNHCR